MPCEPYAGKLQCEMEDGSWWEIPLNVVVDHVARLQHVENVEDLRKQIMQITTDEEALIKWAEDYVNWSDLRPFAVQIKPPIEPDYEDVWPRAMKRVLK